MISLKKVLTVSLFLGLVAVYVAFRAGVFEKDTPSLDPMQEPSTSSQLADSNHLSLEDVSPFLAYDYGYMDSLFWVGYKDTTVDDPYDFLKNKFTEEDVARYQQFKIAASSKVMTIFDPDDVRTWMYKPDLDAIKAPEKRDPFAVDPFDVNMWSSKSAQWVIEPEDLFIVDSFFSNDEASGNQSDK